ncbi:MAG: hypothetical protein LBC73_06835, partial [Oscillospiraceae bacterium]|nr:hypothetical protein [Oscillospiraceae bacterium]
NAKVGIFEDGRVFVITGDNNPIDEKNIELHILTPISREEMPEKIILTMAGLTIMEDARQAITAFNRQNPNYRIEIYEYVNQSDFKVGPDGFITNADEVWDQAMLRFQVDIVTGNIPDFIFQPPKEMYNQNLLLDLYPFIDADPEINREDFLPNVLAAMESSNGKLYSFGNQFAINAIVSRHELLGHIEKWTPAEIYRIINDTQDMQFPFGTVMLRELFIRMMLFTANMGFIDWNNYLAHFDTDEFIDLLYTSMLLPSLSDIPPGIYQGDTVHEIIKMQRGEQLLKWGTFWGPSLYQLFADSFDDMIILGLPNVNGGIYTINASGGIGIGASTEHPDITWEFLRSLLLKTSNDFALNTYSNPYFPVRIDLFDELIEDIMKPRTRTGAGGERVEYPREVWLAQDDSGYSIELYAMSQEKADNLRIFVKSAIPTHRGIDNELWVIIQSDLEQFYAGTRSAEDTARIIQSRAQIWLSELELIYEN